MSEVFLNTELQRKTEDAEKLQSVCISVFLCTSVSKRPLTLQTTAEALQ